MAKHCQKLEVSPHFVPPVLRAVLEHGSEASRDWSSLLSLFHQGAAAAGQHHQVPDHVALL